MCITGGSIGSSGSYQGHSVHGIPTSLRRRMLFEMIYIVQNIPSRSNKCKDPENLWCVWAQAWFVWTEGHFDQSLVIEKESEEG